MLQKSGIQSSFFTGCKYAAIALNIGSRLDIPHLRNSAHIALAMYIRSNPRRAIVFLNWLLVMVFSVLNVWLGLQTCKPSGFLDVLMLSIAMCPLTLYGWYTVLLEVNTWEVEADTVRVRDFAGLRKREFQKSQVIRWKEHRKANKYNHWVALQVHTARGNFQLLSSGVRNYEALKHAILQGVPMKLPEEESKKSLPKTAIYTALSVALLTAGISWAIYNRAGNYTAFRNESCVKAILSANPVHETGSKNTAWMLFPVRQYPKLEFGIANNDGTYQSAAINEMRRRLHKGDTLTLCIDSADYALHIAKTRQPDFWDRASGSNYIRVLGIRDNTWVYLHPKDVWEWERTEPGPWLLLLLFGGIFLIAAIATHYHNRKAKPLPGAD
jgi:hypothetical protein